MSTWILISLAWTASAHAAEDRATAFARQLSELRTEVEALSETLELERDALRSDLRALEVRKTELEVQVRAQEFKLAELERDLAARREAIRSDDLVTTVLTPVAVEALASLRAAVAAGLPYRTGERLAAIDSLAAKLQDASLDPRRGVGRAWQLVEDELRLSRENVLDRQVIELAGAEQLVDVARIGMVALYFRTEDGRFGHAARTGDGWTWTVLDGPDDVARLTELFDALKKQVRVGWFDLPWSLPGVSR